MPKKLHLPRAACIAALALLTACAQQPLTEPTETKQAYSNEEKSQLAQIEKRYLDGDYTELLSSLADDPLLESGGLRYRSDALKYQAFSHCSLGNENACRNSFQRLLEDNPGYRLTEAENSHPLWGRIFATESRKIRSTRIWIKQE